jgi:hypothetical protein
MKWAGHVAGMGEMINPYRILFGKSQGNLGDLSVNCRKMLKWTLEGYDVRERTDVQWWNFVNTVMNFRALRKGRIS